MNTFELRKCKHSNTGEETVTRVSVPDRQNI
jgi:hypothetical protein